MHELAVGQPAPAFSGLTQDGKKVSLSDFKGKNVVLYFYPKDDTPGCTVEACNFRDAHGSLLKKGAVVIGVSPDPTKSHLKFAEKFSLPFPLIADEDKSIVQAYGVWTEKSMYGKKYMGVERSTFVIDGHGKIKAIFRKVKPDKHVDEVIAALV
jgi:thioredoxin-dependent peroxiredoxin